MPCTKRLLIAALVCTVAACQKPKPDGVLQVDVEVGQNATAKCVGLQVRPNGAASVSGLELQAKEKVTALAAVGASGVRRWPVDIRQQESQGEFAVQALAFADPECTTEIASEHSETVNGAWAQSNAPIVLHVPQVKDGGVCVPAVENCADQLDNDCDGLVDCADTDNCAAGVGCGTGSDSNGAVCESGQCQERNCQNRFDDDNDGKSDCAEAFCATAQCDVFPNSKCSIDAGACLTPTEADCTDGFDNDGDNAVDCDDSDCNSKDCNDQKSCTTKDKCVNSQCVGTTECADADPNSCNDSSPKATCEAIGGGTCVYPKKPDNAACSDGKACTTGDACNASGQCITTTKQCNTPPNTQCYQSMGLCSEPNGTCNYQPTASGVDCEDADKCTMLDKCDGNGACRSGARMICTAPVCQIAGTCNATTGLCPTPGNETNGTVCPGGKCSNGACVPDPTFLNVNASDIVFTGLGATSLTRDCVLNTTANPPTLTPPNCFTGSNGSFALRNVSQSNSGPPATLLLATRFSVAANVKLSVFGDRPLIIIAQDTLTVAGTLDVSSPTTLTSSLAGPGSSPSACTGTSDDGASSDSGGARYSSGGAGGTFGSKGGNGGAAKSSNPTTVQNGGVASTPLGASMLTLTPLRGGCDGGNGGSSIGFGSASGPKGISGRGGGAIQLSAGTKVLVSGQVFANGGGGFEGSSASPYCGAGGAGSGGGILIDTPSLELSSSTAALIAVGGGGGAGERMNGTLGTGNGDNGNTDGSAALGGVGNSAGHGSGGAGAGKDSLGGISDALSGNNGTLQGRANSASGGGGGGGLGVIRINSAACTSNGSPAVIPAATFTGGANNCN